MLIEIWFPVGRTRSVKPNDAGLQPKNVSDNPTGAQWSKGKTRLDHPKNAKDTTPHWISSNRVLGTRIHFRTRQISGTRLFREIGRRPTKEALVRSFRTLPITAEKILFIKPFSWPVGITPSSPCYALRTGVETGRCVFRTSRSSPRQALTCLPWRGSPDIARS